ncbi:hypothetical protein IV102_37965 [bacterium]|nr:hypothetical protein [bacterium]
MPLPEDRLTKLTAETELLAELRYEMERARRYGWDLGLFLVEPEIPQEVNADMHYPILKRLASVCASVMRSVDKGIRYQSSVLYLLPETPLSGVETASGKVRKMFCDLTFEHPDNQETFGCNVRRAIKVFSGKSQKDASTEDGALKLLLGQMRDALKS